MLSIKEQYELWKESKTRYAVGTREHDLIQWLEERALVMMATTLLPLDLTKAL